MRSLSPFSLTPWVRRLIIANVVVYFLSITVVPAGWLFQHFAFDPRLAIQQPWTFISYAFLQAGFMHLAFNMLMLFFFGPAVEERMGPQAFVRYYFLCGLGGAVLSFVMSIFGVIQPTVGASAAIFGVALAFALYWPDAEVYVFPLPMPIKAKVLVFFLVGLDLFLGAIGAADGIAHFAHLGGFLFGFVYLKGGVLFQRQQRTVTKRKPPAKVLVHPAAQTARPEQGEPRSRKTRWHDEDLSREVDRVLDKISKSGLTSLTTEERKLLDEMSRQLRDS